MSTVGQEKLEFKSELKQILNIITHSLYSHKEVFLRELISNASDAIDKVRFNSLNNEALLENNKEWKIRLIVDKAQGTLTVSDNGVGMSRESIIDNLGTIAKSGTREFVASLQNTDAATRPELIGQFGVGFYSAFMVADTVTVVSRPAGTPGDGVRWESDGQGEFTIEAVEKPARGTDVTLHLKSDEKEFLEEWKLRQIVKQFSDFVEHPVVMDVERENDKKEKTVEEETLNSRKAIWLRSKADITPEEYETFYKQISNDFEPPARTIHYSGEGLTEFKALLFLPTRMPFDMRFGDLKYGPKLYIRRVLIMDHCEKLLPPYLRFVKGVVDSSDLPLNVSRELLQQNPLLDRIQKSLVKTVLKTLDEMKSSQAEAYEKFYREFSTILKEGISRDWTNREQIADLLLFESMRTDAGTLTTLEHYVSHMPSDQSDIYYLTGESRSQIEHAPYLEVFRERGWDVLFMTDPIDEFVLPSLDVYKGKHFKAANKGTLDETPEQKAHHEKAGEQLKPLFETLKGIIGSLKEIRVSTRLKESPSCLVSEEGAMGAHMERLMAKLGQAEQKEQRILELNPDHPAVQALEKLHAAHPGDPRVEAYGRLLYEQAVVAEGSKLDDPAGFARRISDLMVRSSLL